MYRQGTSFSEQEERWSFGDSENTFTKKKKKSNENCFFNKDKNLDATKQQMFLEFDLVVQRYDTFKYTIFDKLTQQQLRFTLADPEEVSLQKDRNDYAQLKDGAKVYFYI